MKKLAVIIIIGLVALGSLFLLYRRARPPQLPASNGGTVPESSGNRPLDVQQKKQEAADKSFSAAIQKISQTDQDLDGLTDAEEKKYGTDPTKADTDGDGILDKDEIMIYHTNPLKADTDGDGRNDGYEVRHGLNPNGTGKLAL